MLSCLFVCLVSIVFIALSDEVHQFERIIVFTDISITTVVRFEAGRQQIGVGNRMKWVVATLMMNRWPDGRWAMNAALVGDMTRA